MPTDEPSTYRMRADEVRALIRRLEAPPPPPACDLASEALAREPEPPTLLYRRRGRSEPRTLRGLGFFTAYETSDRPHLRMDEAPPSAHESGVEPDPDGERARVSFRQRARVPASERVRRARRRSLWLGCVIVAILAIAPLLMAIVRRTTGPVAPAESADLVRDASAQLASHGPIMRANVVTEARDAATHTRMDLVRRATEQLLEGDSAGALTAFRSLSRAHPEHLALGHVVRSLEHQLRACAEDVAACR